MKSKIFFYLFLLISQIKSLSDTIQEELKNNSQFPKVVILDNCREEYDICLYSETCTEQKPFYVIATKECVEFCGLDEIMKQSCYMNYSSIKKKEIITTTTNTFMNYITAIETKEQAINDNNKNLKELITQKSSNDFNKTHINSKIEIFKYFSQVFSSKGIGIKFCIFLLFLYCFLEIIKSYFIEGKKTQFDKTILEIDESAIIQLLRDLRIYSNTFRRELKIKNVQR